MPGTYFLASKSKTDSVEYDFVVGCPARFTAKSTMYVHIKKHNQGDEKIIYHCPLDGCSKKYTTKTSLRHHITKHYQGQNCHQAATRGQLGVV